MTRYEKFVRMNKYYRITKFYAFLKEIALKALWATIFFVAAIFLVDYFLIDIELLLTNFVEHYSMPLILSVFYVSETLLGLLPPEIFIAWSSRAASPWFMLFVIATLSYLGGITAYFIGQRLLKFPAIHDHIKYHIAKHLVSLRKWGGFLVFVGAMLPIPHSIVSLACGFIRFNFTHYLLWALFRYLRFFLYALVIFRIL